MQYVKLPMYFALLTFEQCALVVVVVVVVVAVVAAAAIELNRPLLFYVHVVCPQFSIQCGSRNLFEFESILDLYGEVSGRE